MAEHGVGLYRDQGIVLRGIRLGEADRIVSIFTQNHGRVRGVARGIRKSKSRFGGRLEPFTHVDLMLYKGQGDLDTITQAEIIARYPRLREDYPAFCAAGAMADAVERTTPERDHNVRLFVLLRGGLRALDEGAEDAGLLAYAFLAKLASLAGLHPTLEACVGCGKLERVAFSHGGGGAVCSDCIDHGDPAVETDVLDTWSSLIDAGWEELVTRRLAPELRRDVAALLLAYAQWQTESRFRAFGLLPVG